MFLNCALAYLYNNFLRMTFLIKSYQFFQDKVIQFEYNANKSKTLFLVSKTLNIFMHSTKRHKAVPYSWVILGVLTHTTA